MNGRRCWVDLLGERGRSRSGERGRSRSGAERSRSEAGRSRSEAGRSRSEAGRSRSDAGRLFPEREPPGSPDRERPRSPRRRSTRSPLDAVTRRIAATTLLVLALLPLPALATGFTDIGQDMRAEGRTWFDFQGALRVRGDVLYNLDLDRGLTPSGRPLFPVSLADPSAQTLTNADMRLRTDLAFYAPFGGVAVKIRIDAFDNLALGSTPDGLPSAATSQRPPEDVLRIKRVYGEALTPFGILAAGRMGAHWGLGILTNGGDCADCDSGDAADRIAFITPLLSHIFAVAYDFSSVGPTTPRISGTRVVDFEPTDDVHTFTFAFMAWRSDLARERRRKAGKTTVDYGGLVSHRWQDNDIPASYLDLAQPIPLTSAQVMMRGFSATAFDAWFRITHPSFRIESEVAVLLATVDQASLVPGALFRDPVESLQIGAALESEVGSPDDPFTGGLDAGYASGDPAPGFGAVSAPNAPAARPGDLEGAQGNPPHDNRVDNFRFHPDYRIDRILFREIIGTVTDAVYVRPHVRWRFYDFGAGRFTASLAAVASWAIEEASTPGGDTGLGVELDPTVVYESRDGFSVALEYASLFPLAGLDNPAAGLSAKPAQLFRFRFNYAF